MNTFFYDDDEIRRKNRIHFCYLFVLEGLSKSDDNHWSFDEEGQFFNVYNVFKMKKRKKIESGPIVYEETELGTNKEGYGFYIVEINELESIEIHTSWYVYPDGTCFYEYESDADEGIGAKVQSGTFDKVKYQDIVRQMDNLETGWMDELIFPEDECSDSME